ncbi:MAG: RNA polymerase sigma factor RpoD/SigA [bacterium]|nr:RNA polymerase sigma factor RpoD/SigA [bacterium]
MAENLDENILKYSRSNGNKITVEELEIFINNACKFDNILLFLKKNGITVVGDTESLEETQLINNTLESYIKEIKKYPLLTESEEKDLMNKVSLGDEEAREIMIKSNLRLVISIANKFNSKITTLLDLIQEGSIGLIKAVERYDLNRGVKFSTYATWWIRQAIIHYISDKSRIIRIPANMSHVAYRISNYEKKYYRINATKPTISQISDDLNISHKTIRLLKQRNNPVYSLDVKHNNDENEYTLEYFIPTLEEGYEIVERMYDNNILNNLAKSILDERTYMIFKLRYGFDCSTHTYQEIADMLGVTRERIRVILNDANSKLNSNIEFRKMYFSDYVSAISEFLTKPYLQTDEFDNILKSILDDFEYRIACLLFGIKEGFCLTDNEISNKLSISQTTVLNTEMNIIFKLMNNSKIKQLDVKYCINNEIKFNNI